MPRSKTGKAITAIRGPVHGNFAEGAEFTQGVMDLLNKTSNWPTLSAARKETIHMIVHKIHRIVTGNPDHADHWDDIGGYAELGKTDGNKAARTPAVKRKYVKRAKVTDRPTTRVAVRVKPKRKYVRKVK